MTQAKPEAWEHTCFELAHVTKKKSEYPLPVFAKSAQSRKISRCLALAGLVLLAACNNPRPGEAPDGIFDPFEETNRNTHEFNRGIDRAILRPVSKGYTKVLNNDLQNSVGNFSTNLSTPGIVVNNLLQGNFKGALTNTYRFFINTTLGIGGLFDPAAEVANVQLVDTDFGATLHVWGVPEGAFVELPLLGPSTERDAVGKVVDLFTNPLTQAMPKPEKYYGTVASVASKVGDRGRYAETFDSILYDSADSYAQSRMIYLQNRRFELGGDSDASYADPYTSNALDDPYEDPYAE